MYLSHALRAIVRAVVVTGDALWKYVTLLVSGTPPTRTFVSDASVNNAVLTLNGDTRPSNFSPYTQGYYSYYSPTFADFYSFSDTASGNFGTGDFTVEAWVNVTTSSHNFLMASPTTSSWNFITYADQLYWQENGGNLGGTGYGTVPKNQWVHLAASRTGGYINLYINGVRVANVANTYNYSGTPTRYVGPNSGGTNAAYWMSNVRVIKGTGIYSGTSITVPTGPLTAVANTSLLTCQSNRMVDNSNNNIAFAKGGSPQVSGFQPFTQPTSVNVNTLYSTYFDGSTAYIGTATSSALTIGTQQFTVELWVNHTAAGTSTQYFDSATNGFSVSKNTSNQIILAQSGVAALLTSTGTIAANTWTHIAITRNASNLVTIYINGVASGTATLTTNFSNTYLYIGRQQGAATAYMNGYISNVRQVIGTAVYTANFTPPTAPLTAISGTAILTCQDSTLKDNSTNALVITSNGQAQPIPVSPFTQVTTALNTTYVGSGYFDGTGDYLSTPSNAAFDFGTGDFTFEAWIYPTNVSGWNYICSQQTSGGFLFGLSSTTFYVSIYAGSNITFTSSITANSWHHVAAVRSSGVIQVFLNGASLGTSSTVLTIPAGRNFLVGASPALDLPFNGYISNFRAIKGTAVYTSNFAPPAQPLTAVTNTSLLTLQSDQPVANKQFVDNSGNNLVLTQVGNATQGTFSPYGANWSNYFDGSGDYLTVAANSAFQLGTGNYTFEAWVNPTSLATAASNVVFNIGTYTTGLFIRCSTVIEVYTNNVQRISLSTTGVMTANTWQHIALVRNGTACNFYVNGASVASFTDATSISPATATVIMGMAAHNSSEFFTGSISNARLVKGAAVYTAAFTPSTTPLTPITGTSLLTCQSPSIVDNSVNGFTVTKNGDVSVQRFSPFSPVIQTPVSYSTYFNGSSTLNLAASSALPGAGNYTIEFWANVPTAPSGGAYFTAFAYGSSGSVLRCFVLDQTGTKLGIWIGTVNVVMVASTAMVGQWAHIAISRSGTSMTTYINGALVATVTDSTNLNTGTLYLGSQAATNYYTGYISNFRVVSSSALYTAAFTPPTAPLAAVTNTALLTCQSATIVDNSSNAFAITGSGNVIAKTFHPFGTTSYSQYFDGTGDYLTTSGTYTFGTSAFTVEAWVNPSAFPGSYYAAIFGNITSVTGDTQFIFSVNSSGNLVFLTWATVLLTSSAAISLNTWSHVALTFNGTTYRLFINGTLVGSSTTTYNFSTAGVGNVGYAGLPGISLFTGYISNMRIVQGTALYTASFSPPTAPLAVVSGTSLLTCQNLTAIDNSPNAFTLTKNGDVFGSLANPFPANTYTYTTGQSYTPALYGGSVSCDNTSVISSNTVSPISGTTSDWTMEAWCYFNAFTGSTWIMGLGNNTGGNTPYVDMRLTSSGTGVLIEESSTVSVIWSVAGTFAFSTGQWYHLAATRSGSTIRIFANGVQLASGTYASAIQTGLKPFASGLLFSSGGARTDGVNGFVCDARMLCGTALYTAGFVPPAAPLQAIKNTVFLLNMDKAGVADSSRTFDASIAGDTKIIYETPYAGSYYSNYFDGSGDYLNVATNAAFGFGTGDFTIEFWAYSTANARQDWIDISDGTNRVLFYYSGTAVTFYGNGVTAITGAALTLNTWVHYALVKSSGSTKLYVNGTQAGSTYATNQNYGTTSATTVGKDAFGSTYITGYMSNLRIVKGTAVYSANFTPSTTPLTAVAGTSLLTCQSKSFVDNSSNAFTVTKNGDVAIKSYNPFQAVTGSSVYFDGSGDYLDFPTSQAFSQLGSWTLEMWLNPTASANSYVYSQVTTNFLQINLAANNYINIDRSGVGNIITSSAAIPYNAWTHVALVSDGTNMKLYFNGVQTGSTAAVGTQVASATTTRIGAYQATGTLAYIGYIADLRVTKAARYTATFTPPTAPLPTA